MLERSLWYAFLMLGILPGEHLRPPFQTVSNGSPTLESAPWTNFRLCEVALLGHHPRSARHGSTEREFFHFGVHVSDYEHGEESKRTPCEAN